MDDIITYGVFCRSKNNHKPDKWFMFCGWFTEYESAQQIASQLITDGQFTAVKVVERVETFEDVPGTLWERKQQWLNTSTEKQCSNKLQGVNH